MPRPNVHDRLLAAGRTLIHRRSFASIGVADITTAAGVPKGSFYNHFESKEAFGLAALDDYWKAAAGDLRILAEPGPPVEQVRRHFMAIYASMTSDHFASGCLLGNLATEAGPYSDLLRRRAAELFAIWTDDLTACLRAGQDAQQISTAFPAETLARFIIAAWEGAVQRAKVERDSRAFDAFQAVLPKLLAP